MKDAALSERYQGIAVAMHDQEGWRLPADVRQGIGSGRPRLPFLDGPTQQLGLRRICTVVVDGTADTILSCVLIYQQQIRGTKPIADRLHPGIDAMMPTHGTIHVRYASRSPQHGGQVTTR